MYVTLLSSSPDPTFSFLFSKGENGERKREERLLSTAVIASPMVLSRLVVALIQGLAHRKVPVSLLCCCFY